MRKKLLCATKLFAPLPLTGLPLGVVLKTTPPLTFLVCPGGGGVVFQWKNKTPGTGGKQGALRYSVFRAWWLVTRSCSLLAWYPTLVNNRLVCCAFSRLLRLFVAAGWLVPQVQRRIGKEAIRRIKEDYPKALDNPLHDFFNRIQVRKRTPRYLCLFYKLYTAAYSPALGRYEGLSKPGYNSKWYRQR